MSSKESHKEKIIPKKKSKKIPAIIATLVFSAALFYSALNALSIHQYAPLLVLCIPFIILFVLFFKDGYKYEEYIIFGPIAVSLVTFIAYMFKFADMTTMLHTILPLFVAAAAAQSLYSYRYKKDNEQLISPKDSETKVWGHSKTIATQKSLSLLRNFAKAPGTRIVNNVVISGFSIDHVLVYENNVAFIKVITMDSRKAYAWGDEGQLIDSHGEEYETLGLTHALSQSARSFSNNRKDITVTSYILISSQHKEVIEVVDSVNFQGVKIVNEPTLLQDISGYYASPAKTPIVDRKLLTDLVLSIP